MSKVTPAARNPERTRQRLLQAAIRLFSAHGYHAVPVDQIVAAARVNKRMVYHYFGSKEDLYQAAMLDVYTRIEKAEFSAIENTGTPSEKLERLIENYFDFLANNSEFVRLLLWENLESGRHGRRHRHVLTKNPFFVRFREIIEEGIRSGEFRENLNVPHLLIHFIGLCFIYHSNQHSLSESLDLPLADPAVMREGCRQAVALVFQGIQRVPPSRSR